MKEKERKIKAKPKKRKKRKGKRTFAVSHFALFKLRNGIKVAPVFGNCLTALHSSPLE
jgi:hypothetical protein